MAMTTPSIGQKFSLPPTARSLSAKLLILTIAFVMLAEVLIYCPSIGRFRLVYLEERLAAAHLAILALEATPDQMVSEEMEMELMEHVGAYAVSILKPDRGRLMLMVEKPGTDVVSFDLGEGTFFSLIGDAFETLLADGQRVIRVMGISPKDADIRVEVVMAEGPMRAAMIQYSIRILALSLFISLITAALVFLSIHRLLVRPMRRITASMVAFRENPEDASRDLTPSQRGDEVGLAERELQSMQEGLRASLLQKTRLAALGIAVTKINHDLRNVLSTAFLMSDRLTSSEDPDVRRLAPRLIGAIDKAASLCTQTLNFTREGPLHIELARFVLRDLVTEVIEALTENTDDMPEDDVRERFAMDVPPGLNIEGDREQLYRVFYNLLHNALLAGSRLIEIRLAERDERIEIDIADDGPGLPPRARDHLFTPFAGSARKGGTGLGLAIARDIMRAHGGDIELIGTSAEGTCFRLVFNRPAETTNPTG
jgi:signal transduction histidine kinase